MILSLFNDDVAYITYCDESGKVITEVYHSLYGWSLSARQCSSMEEERKLQAKIGNCTVLHDDGED